MTALEPSDDAIVSDHTVNAKSLLAHLKDRHTEIEQQQFIDLQVPRWSDPEIWVRYRPVGFETVDKARITAGQMQANDPRTSEIIFLANVDALIEGCVGVYAKLPDDPDQQYSLRPDDPTGALTRFDPDLAVNLGLNSQSTARQVLRALFFTDGDIVYHANRLSKFSGYAGAQADAMLGES